MKKGKTVVAIIGLLLVLWCGILITDYVRCGSLKAPIFVIELEGHRTAAPELARGSDIR